MKTRCPRLGGQVPLSYCEVAGVDGAPCRKVLDCWWQTFDVETYLRQRLDPKGLQAALSRKPQAKMTGILEAIRQARKHTEPGSAE